MSGDDIVVRGPKSIPPGTYPAKLSDLSVELDKDYGYGKNDFYHFTWTVEGPDEDVTIRDMATVSLGKRAKAPSILSAILGHMPERDEIISRKAVIGTRVLVKLIVNEAGYNKIESVVTAPVERGKRKSEVPE